MSKEAKIVPFRNIYGTRETNGLENGPDYHHNRGQTRSVYWDEPNLRITRLRLLSDPGYPAWDVSYCHGSINGEAVDVQLPFDQLPKRKMLAAIVSHAKRDGVHAKNLGVFDAISTLN
jgi:hypothetical protein